MPNPSEGQQVRVLTLAQKISGRMLGKLKLEGLGAAADYFRITSSQMPHLSDSLVASAPEPLRTLLVAAKGQAKAAKAEQAALRKKLQLAQADGANAALAPIRKEYETALRIGQAVVFLASISPAERDAIATRKEVELAIALRRGCVKSTETKAILGCNGTELDRWSMDGRLPALFRRRMQASFGSCDVRHWDKDAVVAAVAMVELWRAG
jgi:hypothetical protein